MQLNLYWILCDNWLLKNLFHWIHVRVYFEEKTELEIYVQYMLFFAKSSEKIITTIVIL